MKGLMSFIEFCYADSGTLVFAYASFRKKNIYDKYKTTFINYDKETRTGEENTKKKERSNKQK